MKLGQNSVLRTHRKGREGQLFNADNRLVHTETIEFGADRAKATSTITVDTGTSAHKYVVQFGNETISFTSADTNTTNIATGIAAAWNANIVARAFYEATSASAVVTLTATFSGDHAEDITTTESRLTIAETVAPNDGSALPFGRVVCENSTGRGVLPLAASLAQDEATITLTYEASVPVFYTVKVGDDLYSGSITMATSLAASTTALAAAIDNIPGVTAANVADVCTIESDVAGVPIEVTAAPGGAATTGDAVAAKVAVAGITDLAGSIFGISIDTYDEMSNVVGDSTPGGYRVGTSAECVLSGDIWMKNGNSATKASRVYLGTSSTEAGQCFDAAGSGRVLLSKSSGLSWQGPNLIRTKRGL